MFDVRFWWREGERSYRVPMTMIWYMIYIYVIFDNRGIAHMTSSLVSIRKAPRPSNQHLPCITFHALYIHVSTCLNMLKHNMNDITLSMHLRTREIFVALAKGIQGSKSPISKWDGWIPPIHIFSSDKSIHLNILLIYPSYHDLSISINIYISISISVSISISISISIDI
jgi:hypothetical protein